MYKNTIMLTTTISDFRKNLKSYLSKVTDDNETVIINRGKGNGVVILSIEEYSLFQNILKEEKSDKK